MPRKSTKTSAVVEAVKEEAVKAVETIKEDADKAAKTVKADTVKAAKAVKKESKKEATKAETAAKKVKEAAENAAATVKEASEQIIETAKETAAKAVTETEVKVAEVVTEAETVVKKGRKACAPKATVYVEHYGNKFTADEIIEQAVKSYTEANEGKKVKTIEVYVKTEENAAYYVINGEGSDDYKIML